MSNICAGSRIGMGLAYDGIQTRVVCFFFNRDLEFLDCSIFSSETGAWKKHRSKVSNYSRIDNYFLENIHRNAYSYISQPECLFHDGLIYWTVYGYLIVYNLQEDFFEFHDLMRKGPFDDTIIRNRLDECMWVSGGCLHYCYIDKDCIYVWDRFKGEEVDYNDEYYQDEFNAELHFLLEHHKDWWRQKDEIRLETLKTQHPEFFGKIWQHKDLDVYLVIYNLQEDFFEIFDLPGKDLEAPLFCLDECLWMSEGSLQYCYSDRDGFYVWACDMGKEIDYKGEYYDEDGEKIEYSAAQYRNRFRNLYSVSTVSLATTAGR
ncbi:hypothetical protein FRX31_005363 [Thalictrum thalictroides]|uniref:Uncharacterized protein n=1 Tax=Thalictrum thalictroides TaxID=46969 RepID=A0A7J6X7M8_THATH|nr:hypothetical protein FRX31_005363 [Thalictrum thalictroides]